MVLRILGKRLESQRDAPVTVNTTLANRIERLDDRDLTEGSSLVAKRLGQAVDLGGLVLLAEQLHQPPGHGGLDGAQLDRFAVMLDGVIGITLELGELSFQNEATSPLGTLLGDALGQC